MLDIRTRLTAPAVILALCSVMLPTEALAYIGPGLGAGAIGAVLGVLGSIFLALFAVVYYPFKRLMKKRRKGERGDGTE